MRQSYHFEWCYSTNFNTILRNFRLHFKIFDEIDGFTRHKTKAGWVRVSLQNGDGANFAISECEHIKNMSPFLTCFPRLLSAKPFGWGHTRRAHASRRRLIMPLVALVQKNRAHQRLRTNSGAWHSLRSSPPLLQFRLRTSECLYKNAMNQFHPKNAK